MGPKGGIINWTTFEHGWFYHCPLATTTKMRGNEHFKRTIQSPTMEFLVASFLIFIYASLYLIMMMIVMMIMNIQKPIIFDCLHGNAPINFYTNQSLSSATTWCFYIVPEMCQGVRIYRGLGSLEYERETICFGGNITLIICFHLINLWMSSFKTHNPLNPKHFHLTFLSLWNYWLDLPAS